MCWLNYFFTVVFALEMILKLIALGLCSFVKDPMNLFDASLVVVSLVEITLSLVSIGSSSNSAFTAL